MIQNKSSDSELVSGYKNGNEKAFEVLLHRHKSRVYTSIYLIVKDRYIAEDLLQETFIKAYRAIKSFRGDSAFYTWLYRIAINTAKNFLVAKKNSQNIIKKLNWFKQTQKNHVSIIEVDSSCSL